MDISALSCPFDHEYSGQGLYNQKNSRVLQTFKTVYRVKYCTESGQDFGDTARPKDREGVFCGQTIVTIGALHPLFVHLLHCLSIYSLILILIYLCNVVIFLCFQITPVVI